MVYADAFHGLPGDKAGVPSIESYVGVLGIAKDIGWK